MPIALTVTPCTLPVAGNVCFNINATYYVTAQPIYVWPGTSPYQIIGQAGIVNVLSVRDPEEYILPLTPVDLTEVSQLITNSVATTTVPFPHISMTQAQFNQQAFKAATVIEQWAKPILIHCSTGDRASAASRRSSSPTAGLPTRRPCSSRPRSSRCRTRSSSPGCRPISRRSRFASSQRHGTSSRIDSSQWRPSKYFSSSAARSMSSMQRALTSILSGSERGT
jgi:protein tyrosine phosphatase (PTP) superfamily phosphohydrolase (DUF442 family)